MSKYYVDGYQVPEGVTGEDDVRAWQKKLGVTADGIWGKKTQAAYERYMQSTGAPTKQSGGFDRQGESERIAAFLREILRPTVDTAIEKREQANRTQRAEIDADAASRGMESSTYVTDVKSDADRDMHDDIQGYETQYNQTLAQSLESMLTEAYRNFIAEKTAREQMELERQKLAQSAEQFKKSLELEYAKLRQQREKSKQTSQAENGASGRTYSKSDYLAFIANLTESQRDDLFTSKSSYWKSIREQMAEDLGLEGYLELEEAYWNSDDIYRPRTDDYAGDGDRPYGTV